MAMASEKPTSSIIYLARHGQTFGNVERVVKDPAKDSLTEKGEDQALRLGNHLADVKFTRMYCSNLLRAVQTITIAKKRFQDEPVSVIQDSRIREIDDKPFVEQPYTMKVWGKGMDENHPYFDYVQFHAEDCEPVEEVFTRQDSFFEDLFNQLDESEAAETVLIVSHGCLIRFIMTYFMRSDKYELHSVFQESTSISPLDGLVNCSYHKFQASKRSKDKDDTIKKPKPRIVKFLKIHQTEHLTDG